MNLDKALLYLAQKKTKRFISDKLKTDRVNLKKYFVFNKCKLSFEKADKLSKYVLKNKPTYKEFLSKFGKEGLHNIYYYKELSFKNRHESLAKKTFELRKKGFSYSEIITILGLNVTETFLKYTVFKYYGPLAKMGNVKSDMKEERNLKMLNDYKNGLSVNEIAKKYNISSSMVRQILREKFNLSLRRECFAKQRFDKIKLLLSKGLTWSEIGFIFNKAPDSVKYSYKYYKMNYGGLYEQNKVNR